MKHTYHSCGAESCVVCDGGLGLCTVCHGAEASLPTECPGEPMSSERQDLVQAGIADFINGEWINNERGTLHDE